MSEFFIHLFNLSVSATWLIAAVIILRLALKKLAPRWTVCLLWAVVGLRLIIPFSIESDLSLIPSVETLNPDAIYTSEEAPAEISDAVLENPNSFAENLPNVVPPITNIDQADPELPIIENDAPQTIPDREFIQSGIKPVDDRVNGAISSAVDKRPTDNPMKAFAERGFIVWAVGAALMAVYASVNYLLLKRRVSESLPEGVNIRRSENVGSPFILGIIKPKIYLPFGLSPETEAHIIAHERAHLKRLDHLIKPFGYILLTVYWFNPLVWIAYILLCRDIETACDEKVVAKMSDEARKAYAGALLECGIKRSSIAACPVAFGEVGVKQRVKNALTYKKPMFWIIIVAVILSVALSVFFLTAPPEDVEKDESESSESIDSSDVSEESVESREESLEESFDISEDVSDESAEEITEPIKYEGSVLAYTYSGEADRYLEIPEKEAQEICDILNNEGWTESSSGVVGTHVITVGDHNLVYDSVGGNVVDRNNERTLSLTDDENTTIASTLEEEEKILKAMQKTHQTPEGLKTGTDRANHYGSEYTPIYLQLADVDKMFNRNGNGAGVRIGAKKNDLIAKALIKESGIKMWVCTESGRKIDYIYSNSDGIFRFELPKGSYTFLLDSGVYVDKYVYSTTIEESIFKPSPWIYTFQLIPPHPIESNNIHEILTYHDVYEDLKVKVVDSFTKQPLKNVKVSVGGHIAYTDENGIATYDPLLEYVTGIGTSFNIRCEADGYLWDSYVSANLYDTYIEIEMVPIHEYEFEITFIDKYTGNPVSGVEVTDKEQSGIQFYNTVSGEDGVVRGKAVSRINKDRICVEYTATYSTSKGEKVDSRNFTVSIKYTDAEASVLMVMGEDYHNFIVQR